ncbi:MAG: hypothetical protein Kow0062_18550 [Acidobacteriota bacterium]
MALGAVPATAWLALRGTPPPTDALITWLVFLALGLAWSGLARLGRGSTERDLASALVPATYLALVPFAPPLLVVVSAVALALTEGVLGRRDARATLATTLAALGGTAAAALLVGWLLSGGDPAALDSTLGSVLAGLVFGVTAHFLARRIDRRPASSGAAEGAVGLSPPVRSVITACAAGLLASSWTLHPLLIVVAAIPLTLLLLVVARLEADHRQLALSRAELARVESRLERSEKLSALGQLASAVAHELNNPLASLIAAAELLGSGGDERTREKLRERILREARRASLIVSELLAFSRQRRPRPRRCEPRRVIEEVIALRAEPCREQGIALSAEIPPDLPALRADGHQLVQLLVNLVTNAEQAIRGSGSGGRIVVRARRTGGVLELTVSDDGPGIPPDQVERIFEPFFTTKRPGEGTGLGLPICAGIVQEHGGRIDVVSRPGRGTSFVVRLPWVEPQAGDETEPTASGETTAPTAPFGRGRRVLVADDEEGVREVLAEAMARWGFEVVTAATGDQALAAMRRAPFDLGLIDRQMPGPGGTELVGRAERAGCAPRAVIYVTGELPGEGEPDPARPTLAKPFTLDALRDAVAGALARQPAGEPSAV